MSGYTLPTFPFRVPPELEGGTRQGHYPLVIVGGGLCGLTVACDLAVRGISSVLLDEDNTVGVRGAASRGVVYARKSLEVFRRLGIFERIRAKGARWAVGRTLVNDDVVYEFDLEAATQSEQPPFINLQQFYLEGFLVERLAELGRTDLRWSSRVVRASATAEGTTLEVATPAGNYTITADWIIDASGLASNVRDGFGLDTHSARSTTDRWCITDVRFKKTLPAERWTWVECASNEGRGVWQHPLADEVWRLDFQMTPDSDPAYVSRPDVAADRLRRHLGADVDFEIIWVGPYQYRAHLLDDFRHQRVFFIGDAAHVVSPFGARGGNSGIHDAENLSWKLALVMAGRAPERLLDSYSEERRAAALHNLEVSRRTTRFLAPRSPAERTLRSAVLALAHRYAFARALVDTGRLSSAFEYANSAIVSNGRGEAIQNVPLTLPDGRSGCLIDLLPQTPAAYLAICNGAPLPAALATRWHALERSRPVRCLTLQLSPGFTDLADPEQRLARILDVTPGQVLLLRPDLHVAGRFPLSDFTAIASALERGLALR